MMRIYLVLASLCLSLFAKQWVIVGHSDIQGTHLTKQVIRAFYLSKQHYLKNQRIVPLNLKADDTTRHHFEHDILELSRDELHSYWIRQHYLGIRPPKVMASPEAILRYVEAIDGAIGYVPLSSINEHHVYIWFRP